MKLGPNFCHVGLGVNALHTLRVLRANKVRTDIKGISQPGDLEKAITDHNYTHVLIEAPWIPIAQLNQLTQKFPHIHFIVRAHSQIGFLVVEPGAISLIRSCLELQDSVPNFTFSTNSNQLKNWLEITYGVHTLYLPNLYSNERPHVKKDRIHTHKVLKISSFGALRLLKNHTTAAAAAQMIARQRDCDLQFHISVNREEHGKSVLDALRNMFRGVHGMTLVENPWASWSQFIQLIAQMDLSFQVSHTETFNIVTADAISVGTPCVVSPAVDWVPKHWQAEGDDLDSMIRAGNYLLGNDHVAIHGQEALDKYMREGVHLWLKYLTGQPACRY